MPKSSHSVERKVGLAGAALGLSLVGLVVAAQFSNVHHPSGSADDRSIAGAVSAADPSPDPGAAPSAPIHPALVSQSSGDPLLARGFGHLRVAAPATYANLTVYPVYQTAKASAPALGLTAMDAGMSNGVLSVVEPSLTVTNSGHQPAYVPGGEVVPGGDQDQGVASDAVIPAHSPAVSVASFCVEERRSSGPSEAFNHDVAFAIPAVRYAMQVSGDQGAVWGAVATATDHFDARTDTGAYHALDKSASAQAAANPYMTALAAPQGQPVGAVIAVNGRIICADVYRDPALFAQVWPALLHSYALQAAMCPPDGASPSVAPQGASRWLNALDAAPGAQGDGAPGTLSARVAVAQGAGVRTAATVNGRTLLHEAFWTPAAALTNGS